MNTPNKPLPKSVAKWMKNLASLGGLARAKKLSKRERTAIARLGGKARGKKRRAT